MMESQKILLNNHEIKRGQDSQAEKFLDSSNNFSNSIISSYEELDASLNDDLNPHTRTDKLRNSDLADDHSQRSSYDFLNPQPQNYLGVHQSRVVRCISPLPLHKTLSSDGNIIFEPLNPEDTHSFGPNEEELQKVENYLVEKKKIQNLQSLDLQDSDQAPLDSPVNLLVQENNYPVRNSATGLKLSSPFLISNSEDVLFTPTLKGNQDRSSNYFSENVLQINPMTSLDSQVFSVPGTPKLGRGPCQELKTEDKLQSFHGENNLLAGHSKICIVPCKTISPNELTLISDISFTCGSPQLRRDGFFAKKFIEYKVTISALGWSVKRRYNDFRWLRKALAASNPGSYIPPVPPKKSTGNFSDSFIKKRQKMLNSYLSSILRDPVLRSSPDTLVFLKETSEAQLLKYQRSRTTPKKIESFEEIQTIEGETFCDFSEDSSFFNCFSDYLEVSADLEQKFKNISKNIVNSTKRLSKSIQELAALVGELVDSQEILPGSFNNSKCLENGQNALSRWATHEEITANNLENDLKYQFYYKVQEKTILKQLLEERENRRKWFLKWKNKESDQTKNLRLLFGHFNFKIFNEFERVFSDQIIYDTQHFKYLALNEINKTRTLESLWESISSSFFVNKKLFKYT